MLNKIWPVFIIISFIYAFISGNVERVNSGIFESTESAVELCLTFLGTICLWNGIMQIAYKSKLINIVVKILNPLIKKLFPEIKNNEKIKKEISMNIVANIFGLGNAATPLGIKAMESMQEITKHADFSSIISSPHRQQNTRLNSSAGMKYTVHFPGSRFSLLFISFTYNV